jgi:ribokinase
MLINGGRMGKVVVVGSINADMVFTSKTRPGAGETVLGETFTIIPGGKGANQAVAASKLGAQSYMIGCVGNDSNGRFSLNNLKDMGVHTSGITSVDDSSTGVANIIVAEGDNSIIVIPGTNYEITVESIKRHKDIILSADIVLLQLEIPLEVVEYTAQFCRDNDIKVLLNPAPAVKLNKTLIENSTYITPNEHELKIILGKHLDTDDIIKEYPNKMIVTMGSKGVRYHNGTEIISVPSYDVPVVDTTGAGDTFCGAFAASVVKGNRLENSIQFAIKAASLSITKFGAQSGMPTLNEMEKYELIKLD